jgi:hypothetical protein
MNDSPPNISLTEKQARFEFLTAKLVLQAALEDIKLICFRFISTLAEDLAFFEQGKSEIDPRDRPTMHMLRLAKDFAIIRDGNFVWTRTLEYERMGTIAESIGLRWGGRWKSLGDIFHVEYQEGE